MAKPIGPVERTPWYLRAIGYPAYRRLWLNNIGARQWAYFEEPRP